MDHQINLERGEESVGTWISIGSPAVAEVTASLDLDFVAIDVEHTTIGLETVENMVRGIEATDSETASIVRVPWNDNVYLKRILDIGVDGVLVPMIETAEEARELVEAVRYPPAGGRGIGSGRASEYGSNFQNYVENAEDSFVTIAQIESQRGVENAREIASVDGIDAIFLGAADLSGSLDVFAEWESDVLNRHIEQAVAISDEVDIPIGTLVTDKGGIERRVRQGFDFFAVGKDTAVLADGTNEMIAEYERAMEEE
ncbi:aldolase/citrate lyase family protein [Haloterrigena salinisoli]|uniref:HpcH/HpaI aldolase family protein n=1 Tax=Haloterrigena salinisoli TaxID=3132747 RepID=UPI0030CB4CBA